MHWQLHQSDDQCCNSCEAVRDAYRKKGWAFTNVELIDQVLCALLNLANFMKVAQSCSIKCVLTKLVCAALYCELWCMICPRVLSWVFWYIGSPYSYQMNGFYTCLYSFLYSILLMTFFKMCTWCSFLFLWTLKLQKCVSHLNLFMHTAFFYLAKIFCCMHLIHLDIFCFTLLLCFLFN